MNQLPDWAHNIAVFDTETTGVATDTARIVTATVALLDANGSVSERHDWVIDPLIEIPAAAAAVHGISTEVARATGMQPHVGVHQIISKLQELFDRGFPVVAFNASYDFSLLRSEAIRHQLEPLTNPTPVLDPMVLDKQFDRYRKGKRTLTATIEHYGVSIGQAHDAGEDAIAAGRLLQKIAVKYASLLPADLETIHDAQIGWCRQQNEQFQEWMRKNGKPEFVADGSWPVRLAEPEAIPL